MRCWITYLARRGCDTDFFAGGAETRVRLLSGIRVGDLVGARELVELIPCQNIFDIGCTVEFFAMGAVTAF